MSVGADKHRNAIVGEAAPGEEDPAVLLREPFENVIDVVQVGCFIEPDI